MRAGMVFPVPTPSLGDIGEIGKNLVLSYRISWRRWIRLSSNNLNVGTVQVRSRILLISFAEGGNLSLVKLVWCRVNALDRNC
jgi:hypothetical protein